MIHKRFLIVVEGEKTEPTLFKAIFEKYGFTVHISPQMPLTNFRVEEYFINDSEVTIIQGPRNRIGEFLKKYNSQSTDLNKIFKLSGEIFAGIFIIYDVDHASNNDLSDLFDIFDNESDGLLLVSSPCIEVLSDIKRNEELKCEHLSEYKRLLNKTLNKRYGLSSKDYIKSNFEELIIETLEKNTKDFNSNNVMEHPSLVIELINKHNIRHNVKNNTYVIYRYFTTVIYVAIAYILNLTKEIENVNIVKEFFKKQIKKI